MHFTKKAVLAAIVSTLVLGLVVTVGVGIGIVSLWPVAQTLFQNTIGNERIAQWDSTRAGMTELAKLAGNPGLAEVLKFTAAIPALVPLIQNGGYQKALEEAMRQSVPSIAQIRLDEVVSPEVRALLQDVQQTVAKNPQVAEAASTVNANVLSFLKSETFLRLRQNPDFSQILSGGGRSGESESEEETE